MAFLRRREKEDSEAEWEEWPPSEDKEDKAEFPPRNTRLQRRIAEERDEVVRR